MDQFLTGRIGFTPNLDFVNEVRNAGVRAGEFWQRLAASAERGGRPCNPRPDGRATLGPSDSIPLGWIAHGVWFAPDPRYAMFWFYMPTFVEFVFPFKGPFGREMVAQYKDLAHSITQEPGFLWKIWIENEQEQQSGGLYLFKDRATAKTYSDMHKARLSKFGLTNVETRMFDVNEAMSALTHGPLAPSAT